MKCTSCGTELKEGARFCKACGCAVSEEKEKVVLNTAPDLFQEIKERLELLEKSYTDGQQAELEQALLEKAALEEELGTTQKELLRYKELAASLKEELIQKEQQIVDLQNASAEVQRCPNCHAEIDEHTIFCGECGTKVR